MEEELELRQYWDILRKRWLIVVVLPLLAALTSGVISFFVIAPVYQASTTLIVGKKATVSTRKPENMIEYDVLLANQELAKTYAAIAQSRTVEQNVLEKLKLSLTVDELNSMISVNRIKDTDLLEIKVTAPNPEQAASLANTMAEEFSQAVVDIKKVDSVSIVDKAVPPTDSLQPNIPLNVLVALAVGLMASVGVAFLLESLDNTIKLSQDVEECLGIPVLGIIPNYNVGQQTFEQMNSLYSAAYRTLGTNVQCIREDLGGKIIMVTSSGPREGTSNIVADLALSLGQAGQSVLVIDVDLRNPSQHELFGLDQRGGFSVAAVQVQDYRNYLRKTAVPGVTLLTACPIPPNPAEFVGLQRMKRLLDEVSEAFDLVLIDTPPVMAVLDASLAQEVDGVILVLASGEVSRASAQRTKGLLESVGAKIIGVVLNKQVALQTMNGSYFFFKFRNLGGMPREL